MSSSSAPELVRVSAEGRIVVLAVSGVVDGDAGRLLIELASGAVAGDVDGIEVDLADVDDFTDDGAAAIVECRSVATPLPCGVRFRARSLGARRLLMAAAARARG